MSDITPRSPFIQWDEGFKKHWNGDPVSTQTFNALSFMFPQGERLFIKVVKEIRKEYSGQLPAELDKDTQAFILQETSHTKHHLLYNKNLESQGYENTVYNLIDRLEQIIEKYLSPKHKLAIVCAYEHYTAILGDYLLRNPDVLKNAPRNMSLIWEWHAAEETEHKAVCFDLYQFIGGSWLMRSAVFLRISFVFLILFSRLYVNMLGKDGALKFNKLPSTICQSLKFFWGRKGVGWHIVFHSIKYLSPSFHPWNQDNKHLLKQWLIRNNKNLEPLSNKQPKS